MSNYIGVTYLMGGQKAVKNAELKKFFEALTNYPISADVRRHSGFVAEDLEAVQAIKDVRDTRIKSLCENVLKVKDLEDLTIGKAIIVQRTLYWLNVIMFFLGVGLIIAGTYQGFVNSSQETFSAFIGATGFTGDVSSFLVGSMQRTQKTVSDLANVELSMNTYYDQLSIWATFIVTGSGTAADLEKASDKLDAITKDMVDLLEKYVQEK